MQPVSRRAALGLVVAFCLLWVAPAQATIALVTNTAVISTNGNGVTTPAVNTTGSTLLVAACIYHVPTGAPGMSDSKSNTWVQASTQQNAANVGVDIYYVKNPTSVGSGHTFSCGTTSSFPTLAVATFSGTDTTANVDQTNGAQNVNATALATGSVTPSAANELVVTAEGQGAAGGSPFTINLGFTITDQKAQVGGQADGGGLAYLIQTTATAVNPTWTGVSNGNMVVTIATFKAAAAGGTARKNKGRTF